MMRFVLNVPIVVGITMVQNADATEMKNLAESIQRGGEIDGKIYSENRERRCILSTLF